MFSIFSPLSLFLHTVRVGPAVGGWIHIFLDKTIFNNATLFAHIVVVVEVQGVVVVGRELPRLLRKFPFSKPS